MEIEVPEEVLLLAGGITAGLLVILRLAKLVEEREARERLESSRNDSTRRAR